MNGVRTLDQRRRDRVVALQHGVDQLVPRLASYAKRQGGRYILFGSAASGDLHDLSDVDLIADFPQEVVIAACAFADACCSELGLTGDVRPASWTSDVLMDRALSTGRVVS